MPFLEQGWSIRVRVESGLRRHTNAFRLFNLDPVSVAIYHGTAAGVPLTVTSVPPGWAAAAASHAVTDRRDSRNLSLVTVCRCDQNHIIAIISIIAIIAKKLSPELQ